MSKVESMSARRNAELDAESNSRFADHVQSIAFNLTLSRTMITGLGLLWHGGGGSLHNPKPDTPRQRYISGHSVPICNSLIRRGLVIHIPMPPPENGRYHETKTILAHRAFRLTPAGLKVCELLVIAGLLESVRPEQKRARR